MAATVKNGEPWSLTEGKLQQIDQSPAPDGEPFPTFMIYDASQDSSIRELKPVCDATACHHGGRCHMAYGIGIVKSHQATDNRLFATLDTAQMMIGGEDDLIFGRLWVIGPAALCSNNFACCSHKLSSLLLTPLATITIGFVHSHTDGKTIRTYLHICFLYLPCSFSIFTTKGAFYVFACNRQFPIQIWQQGTVTVLPCMLELQSVLVVIAVVASNPLYIMSHEQVRFTNPNIVCGFLSFVLFGVRP